MNSVEVKKFCKSKDEINFNNAMKENLMKIMQEELGSLELMFCIGKLQSHNDETYLSATMVAYGSGHINL